MDPAVRWWQDYVLNNCLILVKDFKFDAIYLDHFPYAKPNYDPSSGHSIGGGNYIFIGYREMLTRIRNETKKINPDITISVERICEIYIPYVDTYVWGPNAWETLPPSFVREFGAAVQIVPVFEYIYHQYIVTTGMMLDFNGFPSWGGLSYMAPEYWRIALARALVWGFIPTAGGSPGLSNSLLKGLPLDDIEFLKKLGMIRSTYAHEFLVYGQMLISPEIEVPNFEIADPFWKEWISSRGYNHTVFPSIIHSLWKAPSGDICYIFVNVWNQSIAFNVSINFSNLNLLPGRRYVVYSISDGDYELIDNNMTYSTSLNVTVHSNEVKLIVVTQAKDIAITSVKFSKDHPILGETIIISVTVVNKGNISKTFDVILDYIMLSDPLVGVQTITLANNGSVTLNFTWTPTASGRYEIKAYTSTIPEDVNSSDNLMIEYIYVFLNSSKTGYGIFGRRLLT
jgi:hypothetical protein